MNWTSVDPGTVEVGQYVRWVEGKFSPNYQDRFPASYLATVGQVVEITPKGLQLRIIASVGEAPLTVTDPGNKPTFRTKAKLAFCLFEVRGGKPEGTAHESAKGALAAWERRRTGGLEPPADNELDSRLSQGERSPLPAPPAAEIETSSQTEVQDSQGSPEGNLQPQVMGRRLRTHSTVYIDAEVRSELANLLHLTNDPADGWLWRLTDHLAFGSWLDEETGAIVLDHRSLGAITARSHRSGSFSAYDYIQEYQLRTGARLTVSSPNALAGKARTVESLEFPTGVDELLRQARRTTCPISERVALDTGLPWSNNIRVQQRLFTREEALIRGADAINPDGIRLLRLLNEAPPNRWANFDDHLPNLREVAAGLDPESREYALNVLARVEIQPKPFFKPVERTCRLYGIGTTLLSLPREVRKALVHAMGWRSLDLRQAQLAVVSRLWKVPRLEALIQSRTSFWAEMLTVLGLDLSYKPFVKNLLYALVFG